MRTQSAFGKTEDKIARTLKQIAEKTTGGSPAKSHDTSGHAGYYQGKHQLHRTNPGPDGCTEFQVSHAHATKPTKYTEKRYTQSQSCKALPNAAPTMKPGRNGNSRHHKRKHEPIRDTPAAQVRKCRHGENNKSRPPGDRVHMRSLSPRCSGAHGGECNSPSKSPKTSKELNSVV